jgi:hypothetical protein
VEEKCIFRDRSFREWLLKYVRGRSILLKIEICNAPFFNAPSNFLSGQGAALQPGTKEGAKKRAFPTFRYCLPLKRCVSGKF